MVPKSTRAFTLIELLVVIAIIGILSAVVLASLSLARERANTARVRQDFRTITTAIEAARANTGNTLMQITAHGCSSCVCRDSGMASAACTNRMTVAFNAINTASDGALAGFVASGFRDPWG